MRCWLPLLLGLCASSHATFNLSNTLGDNMVLQREPQSAIVWGFAAPGTEITTTFLGKALPAVKADSAGVWRQKLPPQPATKTPTTIVFAGSDGGKAELQNVLFGDVMLCSGQSNMQYTPHSMAGMNNLTAELAAADAYRDSIRFFTVGMDTKCGDPKKNQTDCSQPFRQLNTNIPHPSSKYQCRGGQSCRENWEAASSTSLGGNGSSWNTFSAICWLTGREIYDALGGTVPIGLISSNWGGTPVQVWQPLESAKDCNPKATTGGTLYNSMIAPFTVGPMALTSMTWYQGESNVGQASYYSCAFPSMIKRWRELFQSPDAWFGFVQIAGFRYSVPYGNPPRPEIDHSHAAGDLRQAQLAALQLPMVGMTTSVDTGDWTNIHPPDKQNPSKRLANQALVQIYNKSIAGAMFPLYAGASSSTTITDGGTTVTVTVSVTEGGVPVSKGGKPVALTTDAPAAATQTSTLGKSVSVPRTKCITSGFAKTFPQDCGYPQIIGTVTNGTKVTLNATAAIGGSDSSSIILTAADAPPGFTAQATSYGRASWPVTVFFSKVPAGAGLPVIPWYSNISATDPWTPPVAFADIDGADFTGIGAMY